MGYIDEMLLIRCCPESSIPEFIRYINNDNLTFYMIRVGTIPFLGILLTGDLSSDRIKSSL